MIMNEFVFCPRCGAVTKPGVCSNCGYTFNEDQEYSNETEADDVIGENINDTSGYNYDPLQNTKKSSSKTPLIILIVAFLLIIVFLIIFGIVILIFGLIPIFARSYMNSNNNIYTTAYPSPYNPGSNNPVIIPNTNDPEDDIDTNDTNDPNDPNEYDPNDTDETYYAENIEPKQDMDTEFDYDTFCREFGDLANEFRDEVSDENNDYFIYGEYNSYLSTGSSHAFIGRDQFPVPYYNNIVDSYIENENYDVERHIIRYEGEVNGAFINAYCAYYIINSDDADFEEVNNKLRDRALIPLNNLLNNKNLPSGEYFSLYCDSIITFNNDEIMSIVYDDACYYGVNWGSFNVHGMNIDIKNASLMDNTSILNLDDDFSKFFIERSNIQNSYVDAINNSPIADVTQTFNNDEALIIFFTPLGIEVGVNYYYLYSYGWVTVTINDFDDHLSGKYDFDADFGKGYDVYQYEKDNGIDGFIVPEDEIYTDI